MNLCNLTCEVTFLMSVGRNPKLDLQKVPCMIVPECTCNRARTSSTKTTRSQGYLNVFKSKWGREPDLGLVCGDDVFHWRKQRNITLQTCDYDQSIPPLGEMARENHCAEKLLDELAEMWTPPDWIIQNAFKEFFFRSRRAYNENTTNRWNALIC